MSLFITPDPPPSLFRASWWHPEGKTPGGRRHRLGGGGGQRPSGGPGAFGKAQERHTQDFLQVWQDHDRVLPRCRWHDQRVRPQMFSFVHLFWFKVDFWIWSREFMFYFLVIVFFSSLQLHLPGVCFSYSSPRSSQERRWIQTRQATHV